MTSSPCNLPLQTQKSRPPHQTVRRTAAVVSSFRPLPPSTPNRMLKEVASYEKEAKDNEARVQKMRDDGKDSYDIKKQEEVLQESYMMIPDSKNRLAKALQDLESFLGENKDAEGMPDDQLEEAKGLLVEAGVA
ncbi:unnamed protein product [Ascophyllum nodosum]